MSLTKVIIHMSLTKVIIQSSAISHKLKFGQAGSFGPLGREKCQYYSNPI